MVSPWAVKPRCQPPYSRQKIHHGPQWILLYQLLNAYKWIRLAYFTYKHQTFWCHSPPPVMFLSISLYSFTLLFVAKTFLPISILVLSYGVTCVDNLITNIWSLVLKIFENIFRKLSTLLRMRWLFASKINSKFTYWIKRLWITLWNYILHEDIMAIYIYLLMATFSKSPSTRASLLASLLSSLRRLK